MKSTTISKLKAHLSSHLKHVQKGEEVVVTDHGMPVARIIPFVSGKTEIPAYLKEMAREGLVRIGSGKIPPSFWTMPRPHDTEGRMVDSLLEERDER